jgi:hypothetical protein
MTKNSNDRAHEVTQAIGSALHWEFLMKNPAYAAMAESARNGDEAACLGLCHVCAEAGF